LGGLIVKVAVRSPPRECSTSDLLKGDDENAATRRSMVRFLGGGNNGISRSDHDLGKGNMRGAEVFG